MGQCITHIEMEADSEIYEYDDEMSQSEIGDAPCVVDESCTCEPGSPQVCTSCRDK